MENFPAKNDNLEEKFLIAVGETNKIYKSRLNFISMVKSKNLKLSDEKVTTLSFVWSNMKFLKNRYPQKIEDEIAIYDPELIKSFETNL